MDGERTGSYVLGGEEPVFNSKGESVISLADYAIAMVDEIESGEQVRERVGFISGQRPLMPASTSCP